MKNQEPNTLTGLLKQFFRELEPGLIKEDIARECINCVSKCHMTLFYTLYKIFWIFYELFVVDDIPRLKSLIDNLETTERATLKFLIKHLTK